MNMVSEKTILQIKIDHRVVKLMVLVQTVFQAKATIGHANLYISDNITAHIEGCLFNF